MNDVEPANSDFEEVWADEIDRRCAALDEGEALTCDWSEFKVRVELDIFGR